MAHSASTTYWYDDNTKVVFTATMVRDHYGVPGSPVWWTPENITIEEVEIGDEIFSEKQLPKKLVDDLYELADEIDDWDWE